MHSFLLPSFLLPVLAYATPLTLRRGNTNPVYTSSFTWNDLCGPTVACGPAMAGIKGQGTTAANNVTFAADKPIVNGKGAGCGQCWHLQATADPFPQNGKTWGTPVVAKINDQCTDGGYCDQTESRPLNTGYGKQVHFDLCGETGTAPQFFGALGMGVLTGYAQQVDCSMLDMGTQGSGAGNLKPAAGGGSPAATWKHQANGPDATKIASSATANPSISPWTNSTASKQSGGQSSGGQSNGGQSGGQSGCQSCEQSGGQSGSQSGGQSGGQSNNGQSSSSGGTGSQPKQIISHQQLPANSQSSQQKNVVPAPQQQQQKPQTQPQSKGNSHGSMKGLEDAAMAASGGGVQGMISAMENYMEEALAGDAPDDDEEDDECEADE